MPTKPDPPLDEALRLADDWIRNGFDVHQKFTCNHCGSRQGIDSKNTFYKSATCEECGKVSEITHCGFLAKGKIHANRR